MKLLFNLEEKEEIMRRRSTLQNKKYDFRYKMNEQNTIIEVEEKTLKKDQTMKLSYRRLILSGFKQRLDISDFLLKKGITEFYTFWYNSDLNHMFFEIDINNTPDLYLKLIEKFNLNEEEVQNRFYLIDVFEEDYFLSFKERETNQIINMMEQEELNKILNSKENKKRRRL